MTSTAHTTTISLDALKRALEERDAAAQIAFFDEDAEFRAVDRDHPPSNPLVFRGREAIQGYLEDVAGRDMTHQVERAVADGDTAAYVLGCRYPDRTQVRCVPVLVLTTRA